jgi:hypothetical protein
MLLQKIPTDEFKMAAKENKIYEYGEFQNCKKNMFALSYLSLLPVA